MPQSRLGSMQGSTSTESRLLPKAAFHQRLSSTGGHLPPKVVFHQRTSSTKGSLPLKVIFHLRLSSTEGRHPPQVNFHQKLPTTKVHLPWKVVRFDKIQFNLILSVAQLIHPLFVLFSCCNRCVVFIKLIHLNDLFDNDI